MLSLQAMLLVAYGWTVRDFERRIERRLPVFGLVSVLVLASVPLFFQGYSPLCGACWLPVPLPMGCGDWFLGDGATECLHGSPTLATVYLGVLFLSVVAVTVFCTGAMVIIYLSVHRQDQAMAQYRHGSTRREAYARSRSIRTKMVLYASNFYICWILPLIVLFAGSPPALRLVGFALLNPLMGFLNMLVFVLPKCRKHQKARPGTRLPAAYVHVLLAAPLTETWRWATTRMAAATSVGAGAPAARTRPSVAGPGLWAVDADVGPSPPRGSEAGSAGEEAAVGGEGEDAPAEDGARPIETAD